MHGYRYLNILCLDDQFLSTILKAAQVVKRKLQNLMNRLTVHDTFQHVQLQSFTFKFFLQRQQHSSNRAQNLPQNFPFLIPAQVRLWILKVNRTEEEENKNKKGDSQSCSESKQENEEKQVANQGF